MRQTISVDLDHGLTDADWIANALEPSPDRKSAAGTFDRRLLFLLPLSRSFLRLHLRQIDAILAKFFRPFDQPALPAGLFIIRVPRPSGYR
jgi:hypothetical protein